MIRDKIEGSVRQVIGNVKKRVGRYIGDDLLQADGAVEEYQGKVQRKRGRLNDVTVAQAGRW